MSFLVKHTSKKLFEQNLEHYTPQDPLYEFYTDKNGKQKRRKRPIPPGLSKRDARILQSVQKRAHHLDKSFSLCGLRFGWTLLIGLLPLIGDAAVLMLNYSLVVRKAREAEIPPWLVRRMVLHLAVAGGVGFVPLVGDVVAAMYKASSRNAGLLEEFLRVRGREAGRAEVGGGGEEGKRRGGNVSWRDVEQVKPGAGLEEGEAISSAPQATMSD